MFKSNVILTIITLLNISSSFAYQITGRITSETQLPLKKVDVWIRSYEDDNVLAHSIVDQNGKYACLLDTACYSYLFVTAIDHYPVTLPLESKLIDSYSTISINLVLSEIVYSNNIENIKLLVEEKGKMIALDEKPFEDPNGRFYFECKVTSDSLKYQLMGADIYDPLHSINGGVSDKFEYDGDGDYKSILIPKDYVVKIPISNGTKLKKDKEKVTCVPLVLSKYMSTYLDLEYERKEFQLNNRHSADVLKVLNSASELCISLKKRLKSTSDASSKKYLLLQLLEYTSVGLSVKDSVNKTILLDEEPSIISPQDPVWLTKPSAMAVLCYLCKDLRLAEQYLEEFLLCKYPVEIKAEVLYNLLNYNYINGDAHWINKYYSQLCDQYASTSWGKFGKQKFVRKTIRPKLESLLLSHLFEDTSKVIDLQLLSGKYVLIDFWATWCGPCILEIKNLKDVYSRFRNSNFEIVSCALDDYKVLKKFWERNQQVDWIQLYDGNIAESKLAKEYGISEIPAAYLISPNGEILSKGNELRGANLIKTLSAFMSK